MLRVGLLGCGRIGQVHAMTISSIASARLAAVSDAVPDAASKLATQYGSTVMAADALMTSDAVDAVAICTPTTTHFDLIHAAAAAGKAIFCEKPIDLSTERTRLCIDAVAAAGVPFMTAFNRRFDPSFARLKAQLDTGVIGNVEIVSILSRDPSPPPIGYIKQSGGLFRDMMVHDFDMARFLLPDEPVRVHAVGANLVDPAIGEAGDVDTAAVMLETASGRLCQISNSRRATYGYDQRIEVHGSKGLLKADNQLEHSIVVANETGFTGSPTRHFFLERYADAYKREMEAFVDAVSKSIVPSPSIDDGLKAQILADAAQASFETGQPTDISKLAPM
ncbi:MAG: inositol 2-dehydrogenase [Pseudomonadota bacterium]